MNKLLPVRIYGDNILRVPGEPVKEITAELKQFIEDLKHTMYIKDGVGLAAPQVGVSLRIFVIDPTWAREGKKNPVVLINPEIKEMHGITTYDEGCLSLPGIYEEVERAKTIKIIGKNEKWENVEYNKNGLFAIVAQHEFDHLNGILFIDRLSKFTRLKLTPFLKRLTNNMDKEGNNLDINLPESILNKNKH